MTLERLLSLGKEDMDEAAKVIDKNDVGSLIPWLNEQNDAIRYNAFLLLMSRSRIAADAYAYWNEFSGKLQSDNSYQRSIGLMLMAANARWDEEGRFNRAVDAYLSFCDDEKPMVVRLCIQNLSEVVPCKPELHERIVQKLVSIDLSKRKDTQRKLLLKDILGIITAVNKITRYESIDRYIADALAGGLLSPKEIKEVQALMA